MAEEGASDGQPHLGTASLPIKDLALNLPIFL